MCEQKYFIKLKEIFASVFDEPGGTDSDIRERNITQRFFGGARITQPGGRRINAARLQDHSLEYL